MGALCCAKKGDGSPKPLKKKKKKGKGSASASKDFDFEDFDAEKARDHRVAAEVKSELFELETKDRELDQRDQDAVRTISAQKQAKKGEYKGWKKRESVDVASLDSAQ